MKHTVTVEEIEKWAGGEVWHCAASSHGAGSDKWLEMSYGLYGLFRSLYRVRDHDTVTYIGFDLLQAVEAYNQAP